MKIGSRLNWLTLGTLLGIIAMVAAACGGGSSSTPTAAPTQPVTQAPTAIATPRPTPTPVPPSPTPTPEQPRTGGILRWAMPRDLPGTLDMHLVRDANLWQVMPPALNWLINTSSAKGLLPDLATQWSTSQDGKTLTMKLVGNAKWHDGPAVTADDVVASIQRLAFGDEGAKGPYRSNFSRLQTVTAPDPTTVQFTLLQPSASFLAFLGTIGVAIYPKAHPVVTYKPASPASLVGSGPFVMKTIESGIKTTLARNPNYFKKDDAGRQLPYLDGLEIYVIPDAATQYNLFKLGQIDMTSPAEPDALAPHYGDVAKDIPGTQFLLPHFPVVFMAINADVAPWSNVQVRQALSLALDRQAFMTALNEGRGVIRGFSTPGTQFAVPDKELSTWPGYNPTTKKQDIEKAKQLLQAAGVTVAQLKTAVPVRDIYQKSAEIAVALLKEALGVDWTIDVVDTARGAQAQSDRLFNVTIGQTAGAMPDPSAEMDPFVRTKGSLNYGRFTDPAVDASLDELDRTLDSAKRIDLSRGLEKDLLVNKAWWIIAGSNPRGMGWRSWVKNFPTYQINQEIEYRRAEAIWMTPRG
ncbi:MAG: ABC transporter substrate-binding protein [Chloroflexi bacterium]|nr:ABC transporter substrate-binding protein [Chloroflexota bacterium]